MEKSIVCDWNRIENMCDEIINNMRGTEIDYIAAVSRGGLVPGVILSHKMNVKLHPVIWSTRDFEDQFYYTNITEDLDNGKKILLIDDINDTGLTFSEILESWEYNPNIHTVITASLFQRHTSKASSDVYSELIKSDAWIIFPWENC